MTKKRKSCHDGGVHCSFDRHDPSNQRKAGIPILCTPVERRVGEEGRLAHTLSAFLSVLRELSRTEEVDLFDLNRYTYHYYDTLGLEASKALFVWLAPDEHPIILQVSQMIPTFQRSGRI